MFNLNQTHLIEQYGCAQICYWLKNHGLESAAVLVSACYPTKTNHYSTLWFFLKEMGGRGEKYKEQL